MLTESLNTLLPGLVHKIIEPVMKKLEEHHSECSKLVNHVEMLEHSLDNIKHQEQRLDYLEDQLVSDQLELSGIPEKPDKNTDVISKRVLDQLKLRKIVVKLTNSNVKKLVYSHRVKYPIKQLIWASTLRIE